MTTLSNVQVLHSCGGLKASAIAEGMTRHGDPVAHSYGSEFFWSGEPLLAPERWGGVTMTQSSLGHFIQFNEASRFILILEDSLLAHWCQSHGARLRFLPKLL
jgi:hypothetical protein